MFDRVPNTSLVRFLDKLMFIKFNSHYHVSAQSQKYCKITVLTLSKATDCPLGRQRFNFKIKV